MLRRPRSTRPCRARRCRLTRLQRVARGPGTALPVRNETLSKGSCDDSGRVSGTSVRVSPVRPWRDRHDHRLPDSADGAVTAYGIGPAQHDRTTDYRIYPPLMGHESTSCARRMATASRETDAHGPVMHADETAICVNCKNDWTHVCAAGAQALKACDIIPCFGNRSSGDEDLPRPPWTGPKSEAVQLHQAYCRVSSYRKTSAN